jgi:predicted transcriptional regulator
MPEFKDYSWVVRGRQRKKIILAMDKPKIPTQIKDDTKLSLNNVSDVLRDFKKKKIAKCMNPKERTGRLYKLTSKGMKIRDAIRK